MEQDNFIKIEMDEKGGISTNINCDGEDAILMLTAINEAIAEVGIQSGLDHGEVFETLLAAARNGFIFAKMEIEKEARAGG